jgi:hypothetical protein
MKYFALFVAIFVGILFFAGNSVLNSFEKEYEKQQGPEWTRMVAEANKGEIFKEKTNGVDNSRLIRIARVSLLEPKNIVVDGYSDVIPAESRFDPAWFGVHKPHTIEYFNDNYHVNWIFLPGCEERAWDTTSTLNWYNRYGTQCSGGWNVSVIIGSDLEAKTLSLEKR